MPVEEMIKEYNLQGQIKEQAEKKQREIFEKIIAAKDKEWDSISVQQAALKSGISAPTIYRWVQNGKLKNVEHKGSLVRVSEKELRELDDKYNG